MDSSGSPFLVQGDAAWSLLVQLDAESAQEYFRVRKAQGFNTLVVNLIEHHYADDPPRDVDGNAPFISSNDFATPNPQYFDHVDRILEEAAQQGFLVLLAPAYLGYEGEEEGWFQEMEANGPAKLRSYGRYVGERYSRFDNIIWLEGGDYTPSDEGLDLVNAVTEGIEDVDPGALHMPHWGPETSGWEVPVPWMDIDTTYTYELVYEKVLRDYERNPNVPHILIESAYEDDIKRTTSQSIRAQAYYALLSGASGQVYGQGDIWKFDSEWRSGLHTPGACGIVHAGDLFASVTWQDLEPDLDGRLLVGGRGEEGTDDYAVAASTPDGKLAVAYLPRTGPVVIDVGRLAGEVRARFYDPSNGTLHDAARSPSSASGRETFVPPGDNAGGDPDWLLVMDAIPA